VRKAAGRFVIPPLDSTIFGKAAQITSEALVEGDYLEFGVFRGNSFVEAFRSLRQVYQDRWTDQDNLHSQEYREKVRCAWEDMRFFAFDSFRGLPETVGLDSKSPEFAEGKFAASEKEFINNLRSQSVDMSKVVIVSGWYEATCRVETREKYGMKAASIIHVDCDLYESAKVVLQFIEPLLVDGTVLIFDDWYCFRGNPGLGEQAAFREWAEPMARWIFAEYQKEGPWCNSFIASRKLT
jgi:hypothetical protein